MARPGRPTSSGIADPARRRRGRRARRALSPPRLAPATGRARLPRVRTSRRAARGTRRASSTSVPQSCSTNGFPVATRPAAPTGASAHGRRRRHGHARRAARAYASRKAATSSAFHGRRRRLPTIPSPYARPKCAKGRPARRPRPRRPAARRCSTASRTKTPGDVVRIRGYDVVRTTTFIRVGRAASDDRAAPTASGREDVEVVEGHREVEDVRDERRHERRRHPPRQRVGSAPRADRAPRTGRGRYAGRLRADGRSRRRTRRRGPRRRSRSRRSSRRRTSAGRSPAVP